MLSMIVERKIQNQQVLAECVEGYARMAANVLDAFESLAASGTEMKPDTQIRFGWSTLRLAEDGEALRVTEPDFARWPANWSPTIDITLRVLGEQTCLLRRLGVDGEDAFFDQVIIAASGALAQTRIFMRRTSSMSPEDSGWLLASTDDPEALSRDDIEPVLIASLVTARPELLQAITLPAGFVALFSGDSLEQVLDSTNRPLLKAT